MTRSIDKDELESRNDSADDPIAAAKDVVPVDATPEDAIPDDERPGDERPGDERPGDERPGDERPESLMGGAATDERAPSGMALDGLHVAFVGRLGGVNRREASQIVREAGGQTIDVTQAGVDLVVIGADELPLAGVDERLPVSVRRAAAEGLVEILSETQFWQRLGQVEAEQHVRRLYTPAMLAELLGVQVATVRRWHRRGLITAVRVVHRLPYFDFQEVTTARRLAALLAEGVSPQRIERSLEELKRFVPEAERSLAQLSVIVEGRDLLLRDGEGLIDRTGQRRINFDSLEESRESMEDAGEPYVGDDFDNVIDSDAAGASQNRSNRATIPIEWPSMGGRASNGDDALSPAADPDRMLEIAADLEDLGRLEDAAEWYRAAMAASGPRADACFQLAEILYRLGDAAAARERYYMAVELDDDFVEARANLGCVLAETGQLELAVAAFEGALAFHADYPDVHYHLARALDELDRLEEANEHWRSFLALAPESPWADEARDRLGLMES